MPKRIFLMAAFLAATSSVALAQQFSLPATDLSATTISCPNHQLMVGFSSTHTGCVLYELSVSGQTIAGIRDLQGNKLIEVPFLNLQYKGN